MGVAEFGTWGFLRTSLLAFQNENWETSFFLGLRWCGIAVALLIGMIKNLLQLSILVGFSLSADAARANGFEGAIGHAFADKMLAIERQMNSLPEADKPAFRQKVAERLGKEMQFFQRDTADRIERRLSNMNRYMRLRQTGLGLMNLPSLAQDMKVLNVLERTGLNTNMPTQAAKISVTGRVLANGLRLWNWEIKGNNISRGLTLHSDTVRALSNYGLLRQRATWSLNNPLRPFEMVEPRVTPRIAGGTHARSDRSLLGDPSGIGLGR